MKYFKVEDIMGHVFENGKVIKTIPERVKDYQHKAFKTLIAVGRESGVDYKLIDKDQYEFELLISCQLLIEFKGTFYEIFCEVDKEDMPFGMPPHPGMNAKYFTMVPTSIRKVELETV